MDEILKHVDPARPVLIAGPTASGKSALALAIAERQGGIIVNADALQVWQPWRILTARPDTEDERRAPHALYGHVRPGTEYSVGHWLRELAPLLDGTARPIIVGGTGLYLSALTEGLADIPPVPPAVRAAAEALRRSEGPERLADELRRRDPATARRIDMANPARVQRAWEVLQATGRGLSAWQAETPPPLLPLSRATPLVLTADRDWLAARIDRRFDRMIEAGALDEVRAVLPIWNPAAPWAQAIGAPELVAHLSGEIPLDAAIQAAKQATRRYAKRQRTWFRARMHAWRPVPAESLG